MKSINFSKMNVGGQAVIEGVMMRAPKSYAIAVRKSNGEIFVKEEVWFSISHKFKFLTWPVIRGVIVLIETLINGISALSFSANIQIEEELKNKEGAQAKKEGEQLKKKEDSEAKKDEKLSSFAMAVTIIGAFALGILMFIVIPHALTELMGRTKFFSYTSSDLSFHLIDGAIKIIFFLVYVFVISLLKDVKRVFQYHGAEHKSIYAYEADETLTIENAKKYSTLHPRCGTSFIILVLLISIIFFSFIYPFMPNFYEMNKILKHTIYIIIKIPIMLPIAGIAYEIIKLSSKTNNLLFRIFILPGVLIQKITTKEPSDDQLEVALCALKNVLLQEKKKGANIDEKFLVGLGS